MCSTHKHTYTCVLQETFGLAPAPSFLDISAAAKKRSVLNFLRFYSPRFVLMAFQLTSLFSFLFFFHKPRRLLGGKSRNFLLSYFFPLVSFYPRLNLPKKEKFGPSYLFAKISFRRKKKGKKFARERDKSAGEIIKHFKTIKKM